MQSSGSVHPPAEPTGTRASPRGCCLEASRWSGEAATHPSCCWRGFSGGRMSITRPATVTGSGRRTRWHQPSGHSLHGDQRLLGDCNMCESSLLHPEKGKLSGSLDALSITVMCPHGWATVASTTATRTAANCTKAAGPATSYMYQSSCCSARRHRTPIASSCARVDHRTPLNCQPPRQGQVCDTNYQL